MLSKLQSAWKSRHCSVTAAAILLLALSFSPLAVSASNYGDSAYSTDVYNGSNSSSGGSSSSSSSTSGGGSSSAQAQSTPEPTVIQTESGLQVAINLTDGQAIPPTGYYITITPLNGQGRTFDKAEIYLDGVLAFSGTPDSTGTLRWLWDASAQPATKVKIIVYGPGSGSTTHEFNVTVSPVQASTTQPPTSAPATSSTASWLLWAAVGLFIAVILFLLWLILRRRRNDRQVPQPPTSM